MRRRTFLAAGAVGLAGLAGCTSLGGTGDPTPTATAEPTDTSTATPTGSESDLPDGVYVQSFRESMAMQGTAQSGEFAAGLMYAAPHAFWNVNGTDLQKTPRTGSIHLMAVVWDPETSTVLPETGVTVEILQDDELVSQEVIYPMLSQRMGFHYGGNFTLPSDGEYVGRVSIGGMNVRRTGAFRGRFGESATVEIPFVFDEAEREKVTVTELDAYGERGAVKPMEMGMMPQATALPEAELPNVLGKPKSDDAVLLTGTSGVPEGVEGSGEYLYVSARTPYNGLVLPAMGLDAVVEGSGGTTYEGPLVRTFDPALGYHYGAAIDGRVEAGDTVTLEPTVPPQVARHEGYERAFLQMDPVEFGV
ncbi:fe2+ transport protein [Salinirubellus salinus]|uniref:Fe2+ transport protein n=1 Tax=Salinirubellus salinus TaxID=1364945 RepID=A0A9E7R3V4_9EURY|nr:fe2+ transport protein [Salinirubellus salinus]UWM54175.1 fe2+ transport protein [Salinirubellus salinus]